MMNRGWRYAGCLLIALPLVASCTSADRAGPTPTAAVTTISSARVEVDIFSGRPNPQWLLGTEQAEELATMIDRLPPASGSTATQEGRLGFRGFLVHGLDSPLATGFDRLRVTQGAVFGESGATAVRFDDSRAEIFSWLTQQSATQLPQALQSLVASPTPPGAGQ